jgi:hypothetical protein
MLLQNIPKQNFLILMSQKNKSAWILFMDLLCNLKTF